MEYFLIYDPTPGGGGGGGLLSHPPANFCSHRFMFGAKTAK